MPPPRRRRSEVGRRGTARRSWTLHRDPTTPRHHATGPNRSRRTCPPAAAAISARSRNPLSAPRDDTLTPGLDEERAEPQPRRSHGISICPTRLEPPATL